MLETVVFPVILAFPETSILPETLVFPPTDSITPDPVEIVTVLLKEAPPLTVNVGLDAFKKLAVVLIPTFPIELKEK